MACLFFHLISALGELHGCKWDMNENCYILNYQFNFSTKPISLTKQNIKSDSWDILRIQLRIWPCPPLIKDPTRETWCTQLFNFVLNYIKITNKNTNFPSNIISFAYPIIYLYFQVFSKVSLSDDNLKRNFIHTQPAACNLAWYIHA